MTPEFLEHMWQHHSDEDWEVLLADARRRRDLAYRSPVARLSHWCHARRYPLVHRTYCITCGGEQ